MGLHFRMLLLVLWSLSFYGYPQEKKEGEPEKKDLKPIFEGGSDPSLFTKVSGNWQSAKHKGKAVLSLGPEPVQECRTEMGPYLRSYNVSISAKVFSKQKSRIKPRMGVGLFGKNGFILRLAPGQKRIELVQYGEVIAEAPLQWKSETWQFLELTVTGETHHWQVSGRTWGDSQSKPELPTLEKAVYPSEVTHPVSGRAFLTGSPFSGYPILYDEVIVRQESKSESEKGDE